MTDSSVSQVDRPEEKRKPPLLLVLTCLIPFLGVVACFSLFAYGAFDLSRPDHWKPGDQPYHADCTPTGCIKLGPVGAPGGDGSKAIAVLGYDPKINDRIAQWADCLQSVQICTDAHAGAPEQVLPACVQQSQCPADCKDHFRVTSAGLTGKPLLKAYLAMFSDKGGYCTPRGA